MLDNWKDLHGDTPEDELTAEQLFERLQGAKLIVESLNKKAEAARIVHSAVAAECVRRGETIDSIREIAVSIAQELVKGCSNPYEDDRNAIIRVVARLLAINSNYDNWQHRQDMDDIPF